MRGLPYGLVHDPAAMQRARIFALWLILLLTLPLTGAAALLAPERLLTVLPVEDTNAVLRNSDTGWAIRAPAPMRNAADPLFPEGPGPRNAAFRPFAVSRAYFTGLGGGWSLEAIPRVFQ